MSQAAAASDSSAEKQQVQQPAKASKGLFRKRKEESVTIDAVDEKKGAAADDKDKDGKPSNEVPPVGFTDMFRCVSPATFVRASQRCAHDVGLCRFSTRTELILDFIGLCAAAAAGAAQVSTHGSQLASRFSSPAPPLLKKRIRHKAQHSLPAPRPTFS